MGTRGRGRIRSESARAAILSATWEIVVEAGYAGLSVEAIAARAGVGKQTIYRWWSSKSDVLAECVLETGVFASDLVPPADTGDLSSDIAGWIGVSFASAPETGRIMRALAAAAAENDDVRSALYDGLTRPIEQMLTSRLDVAKSTGRLSADTDADAVAHAVVGTILYRFLTRPPDDRTVADDVSVLLRALR